MSSERIFTILELYEAGHSVSEIMAQMGLARNTVKSYLAAARARRRTQPESAASVQADRQQAALLEYQRIQWLQQYHQLRLQRDRYPAGSEGWFSYQRLLDELATEGKA